MPKLDKGYADEVDQEEAGDFKPLKPGKYVYRLVEVEEGETGPNSQNPGTPKWVWKLAVDKDFHPELRKGRWQTTLQEHVPLTNNMKWKTKQLFTGFGYTADSDTDEIIEDEDARIVAQVKTGKDVQSGDDRTQAVRYIAFDSSKWERHPEDEDDNQ